MARRAVTTLDAAAARRGGRILLVATPSALALAAAAVPALRLPALLVLVIGLLVVRRSDATAVRLAWAAPIPVALVLVTTLAPEPEIARTVVACADPLSPRAIRRVVIAIAVVLVALAAARVARAPTADLRLRRPSRAVGIVSVGALAIAVPLAVTLGPVLAEPFFGRVAFTIVTPLALLPAFTFAIANAVEEEVAYRGAWLGWGETAMGPALAIAVQALGFGLAHAGADFVGPQLPVIAAMAAGGAIAAIIARRTGSLALPIALHAAADVPMFLYAVCPPA
jgi:membrane protease YdiL (CAAX protease family)